MTLPFQTLPLFANVEQPQEEWRTIEQFPNYAVSNMGRVKRLTSRTNAKAGSILKPTSDTEYPFLTLCSNGIKRTSPIHLLVAAAFLEKVDGKDFVNHINGNKHDARLENLEYTNRRGNQIHAYRTGLQTIDSESGNAKLTWEKVKEIRAQWESEDGLSYPILAKRFGITRSNISMIIRERTWVAYDCPTKVKQINRFAPKKIKPYRSVLRRAKRRGCLGESTPELLLQKLAYYGWMCRYCRTPLDKSNLVFDHAIPLSRGGTGWTSNMMPSCIHCNFQKRGKTFKEFIKKISSPLFSAAYHEGEVAKEEKRGRGRPKKSVVADAF